MAREHPSRWCSFYRTWLIGDSARMGQPDMIRNVAPARPMKSLKRSIDGFN
jgi:hypothetical protein